MLVFDLMHSGSFFFTIRISSGRTICRIHALGSQPESGIPHRRRAKYPMHALARVDNRCSYLESSQAIVVINTKNILPVPAFLR